MPDITERLPIKKVSRKIVNIFNVHLVLVSLIVTSFLLLPLALPAYAQKLESPKPQNLRLINISQTDDIVISEFPSKTFFPTLLLNIVPKSASGVTLYINPLGSDTDDGHTINTPFKSIQQAVDIANAGDLIYLFPGTYEQDIITRKDGKENLPITITGPREAIVVGGGKPRVFEIKHDYITLQGFTIDGHFRGDNKKEDFRDKLLYVIKEEPKLGVNGLKVSGMTIKNSGGECIRLRYFAQNNEISQNTIQNCGIYDFRFGGNGKNGEGIYIGTAPEQTKDGKNPTSEPDESSNNWVHHNVIDTQGNECVDIKEGSSGNIVENNSCTGQKDPDSGGMDARGSGNIFRKNNIFGNNGAGVRLGGDTKDDGLNNDVYNNVIRNNKAGGIKLQRAPGKKVCGNVMSGNNGGDLVGSFKEGVNPKGKCS